MNNAAFASCRRQPPLLLALLLLLPLTATQATPLEDAFRDFSRCDASFFTAKNVAALNPDGHLPTGGANGHLWLKAGNGQPEGGGKLDLPRPMSVADVPLLAYGTDNSDLGSAGLYYIWGFTAQGALADVVDKLRPLVADNTRLHADDGGFVRTEVKIGTSDWLKIDTQGGTAAGTHHVERALIFEQSSDHPGETLISCTLQGAVTPDLLAQDRPDLESYKYPRASDPALYDNTPIPAEILRQVSELQQQHPEWKPSFRSLRYQFRLEKSAANKKPQDVDDSPITVEERVHNNLVESVEIYSANFKLRSSQLGDFVPLKYILDDAQPGKSVHLTTKLALYWPAKLVPGAKLIVVSTSEDTPTTTGIKEPSETECAVQGTRAAKSIHPSLAGKATLLDCRDSDTTHRQLAFIHDLGIILALSEDSTEYGHSVYHYQDMVIEK